MLTRPLKFIAPLALAAAVLAACGQSQAVGETETADPNRCVNQFRTIVDNLALEWSKVEESGPDRGAGWAALDDFYGTVLGITYDYQTRTSCALPTQLEELQSELDYGLRGHKWEGILQQMDATADAAGRPAYHFEAPAGALESPTASPTQSSAPAPSKPANPKPPTSNPTPVCTAADAVNYQSIQSDISSNEIERDAAVEEQSTIGSEALQALSDGDIFTYNRLQRRDAELSSLIGYLESQIAYLYTQASVLERKCGF